MSNDSSNSNSNDHNEHNDDDEDYTLVIPHARQDLESSFVLKDVLGQGSFGVVRKCYPLPDDDDDNTTNNNDSNYFACKTIAKQNVPDVDLLRREVVNLQTVQTHAHIVNLQDVFETPLEIHLISEAAQGGELYDYIVQNGAMTSEPIAAWIMFQITSAISHCHSRGIVHRDLKASNFMFLHKPPPNNKHHHRRSWFPWPSILSFGHHHHHHHFPLLTEEQRKQYHIIIIDFGLSIQLSPSSSTNSTTTPQDPQQNQVGAEEEDDPGNDKKDWKQETSTTTATTSTTNNSTEDDASKTTTTTTTTVFETLMTSRVGTPYYVAPEVLLQDSYDWKCDVWSIGVIAYLVLSGTLPFWGTDERDTIRLLKDSTVQADFASDKWKKQHKISPTATEFVQTLLQKDPTLRPTARIAWHHPWLEPFFHDHHHQHHRQHRHSSTTTTTVCTTTTTTKITTTTPPKRSTIFW